MEVRSGPSRVPRSSGEIGERPERICVALATNWRGVYLSSRGDVSDRVIQQEGRWRSEEYKTYTVYNAEDAKRISRKLSDKDKGVKRQPGEGTVWGSHKRKRISRK